MEEDVYLKESISCIELNTWYFRDSDNIPDMFYCTKIDDRYVEGFGFINNKFDSELHFERKYFFDKFYSIKPN